MQPWCETMSVTILCLQGPSDTARLTRAAKDWLHCSVARLPLLTLKDYMGCFPRRETASNSLHSYLTGCSFRHLFLKLGSMKYPAEHQTEGSTHRKHKESAVAESAPACPCFCLPLLSAELQWKSPRGSEHHLSLH